MVCYHASTRCTRVRLTLSRNSLNPGQFHHVYPSIRISRGTHKQLRTQQLHITIPKQPRSILTYICRVQVAPECITKFNELKLGKSLKYIIYALSDDYKSIIVEDTSSEADWDAFREKLINAKSKTKSGAMTKGPRYAVYDFNYDLASGEGQRSKITFIAWSPDDAGIQVCAVEPQARPTRSGGASRTA